MPPESWLVLTVAAAFLLLGVAGSPLAWVALHQRRVAVGTAHGTNGCASSPDEVRGLENRLARSRVGQKPLTQARRGSPPEPTSSRLGESRPRR